MWHICLVFMFALLAVGDLSANEDTLASEQEETTPPENIIGIYLDKEATVNCASLPQGQHSAYLIVSRPSERSGISGWECWVEIQGMDSSVIVSWDIQGKEPINFASPPRFTVGLIAPLPWSEALVLLEIKIHIFNEEPLTFFIRPNKEVMQGGVRYTAGDNPNQLIELQLSSSAPDQPVALINQDCPEEAP